MLPPVVEPWMALLRTETAAVDDGDDGLLWSERCALGRQWKRRGDVAAGGIPLPPLPLPPPRPSASPASPISIVSHSIAGQHVAT